MAISPSPQIWHLFIYFFLISWRLITLPYCSGFCHTLTWISHGCTCVPHPDPPSHLPVHLIPLGLPSAPGLNTCLMHPAWAGDLFHPRWYTCFDAVLLRHPTLAFSNLAFLNVKVPSFASPQSSICLFQLSNFYLGHHLSSICPG